MDETAEPDEKTRRLWQLAAMAELCLTELPAPSRYTQTMLRGMIEIADAAAPGRLAFVQRSNRVALTGPRISPRVGSSS